MSAHHETLRHETMIVFSYVFLAILCFLLALALFLILPVKTVGQRLSMHSIQSSAVEPHTPFDYIGGRIT